MTAALYLTAWLAIGFIVALPLGAFIGLRRDAGVHPRRGQREEKRAGDVDAELDGGRLPARMIYLNHNEGISRG